MVPGLPIGAGINESAAINPLASRKQQKSGLAHIETARKENARIVLGGEPVEDAGFYIQPMVLTDVTHAMSVSCSEVFGPVLAVIPFDYDEEAIKMANDSEYDLAVSFWTNDLGKAMNLVPRIEGARSGLMPTFWWIQACCLADRSNRAWAASLVAL